MKSLLIILCGITAALSLASCVRPPEEDKPVGPTSSTSQMPWNRPQPGEGQAQFGGMLERR